MADHPGHMLDSSHVDLYRARLLHVLGALPLAVLRISYRLGFRLANVTCVQPVLHCRSCIFEWTMDVCLSNVTVADLDFDVCVRPLLAHDQECHRDARLWHAWMFGMHAGNWTWEIARVVVCSDHIEPLPDWAFVHIGARGWSEHICPGQLMGYVADMSDVVDNDLALEMLAYAAALAFMDE